MENIYTILLAACKIRSFRCGYITPCDKKNSPLGVTEITFHYITPCDKKMSFRCDKRLHSTTSLLVIYKVKWVTNIASQLVDIYIRCDSCSIMNGILSLAPRINYNALIFLQNDGADAAEFLPIKSYLEISVLVAIFCFMPTGICAIVKSVKVKLKYVWSPHNYLEIQVSICSNSAS